MRGPILVVRTRANSAASALPVFAAVLMAVLGWVFLSQTPYRPPPAGARRFAALGRRDRLRTERAAAGRLRPPGLCGAIAGLILVGRVGVVNPDLGYGFEFTVITAVVLGGTSLFGGRGSMLGSVLGACC